MRAFKPGCARYKARRAVACRGRLSPLVSAEVKVQIAQLRERVTEASSTYALLREINPAAAARFNAEVALTRGLFEEAEQAVLADNPFVSKKSKLGRVEEALKGLEPNLNVAVRTFTEDQMGTVNGGLSESTSLLEFADGLYSVGIVRPGTLPTSDIEKIRATAAETVRELTGRRSDSRATLSVAHQKATDVDTQLRTARKQMQAVAQAEAKTGLKVRIAELDRYADYLQKMRDSPGSPRSAASLDADLTRVKTGRAELQSLLTKLDRAIDAKEIAEVASRLQTLDLRKSPDYNISEVVTVLDRAVLALGGAASRIPTGTGVEKLKDLQAQQDAAFEKGDLEKVAQLEERKVRVRKTGDAQGKLAEKLGDLKERFGELADSLRSNLTVQTTLSETATDLRAIFQELGSPQDLRDRVRANSGAIHDSFRQMLVTAESLERANAAIIDPLIELSPEDKLRSQQSTREYLLSALAERGLENPEKLKALLAMPGNEKFAPEVNKILERIANKGSA